LSGLRFDLGFELAYGMRFRADSDAEPDFQSGGTLKDLKNEKRI